MCSHLRFPGSKPAVRKVPKNCAKVKQEVARLEFESRFSKFSPVNFELCQTVPPQMMDKANTWDLIQTVVES